jgi:putative transposase
VRYINKTYQRRGTLWEGRYKSTLVDSDNHFLLVSRYIELNSVRAHMVADPEEYPWSNYNGNALDKDVALLSDHRCYQSLGTNKEEPKQAYKYLFEHHITELTLQEVRDATNKALVLGEIGSNNKLSNKREEEQYH